MVFDFVIGLVQVIYTFKTQHGTTPQSPSGGIFDVYEEISSDEVTYYKWSNDNDVYTELAHPPVVQREDGSIMVIFAGERPALDNTNTGSSMNAPRNIGMVTVSGDLQTILSEGWTSRGGFYDFLGEWKDQENEGIVWLTDFTPNESDHEKMESAVRIKTAPLEPNFILILYEVWGPRTYIRTDIMAIDDMGEIVFDPSPIPFDLRLTPTDRVDVVNGKVVFFGADETGNKVIRFQIEQGYPTAAPSPVPSMAPTAEATRFTTADLLLGMAIFSAILMLPLSLLLIG